MIAKTTWTSGRLEGYARARGLDWRIAHTPNLTPYILKI